MTITYYILSFFLFSFLGWLVEIIYCLLLDHKFTNRGFLIGPYCPIYGCGCLLLIIFLHGSLKDPISLFLKSIVICAILEYFTSYIMEKIFKMRWWDYSNRKFNINGRICLETIIPFGLLGCLVMYVLNPFSMYIFSLININILNILCGFLLFFFCADLAISFKIIFNIRGVVKGIAKDSTDEITKIVRDILSKSKIYKRIIKAFPKFHISAFIKKQSLRKSRNI